MPQIEIIDPSPKSTKRLRFASVVCSDKDKSSSEAEAYTKGRQNPSVRCAEPSATIIDGLFSDGFVSDYYYHFIDDDYNYSSLLYAPSAMRKAINYDKRRLSKREQFLRYCCYHNPKELDIPQADRYYEDLNILARFCKSDILSEEGLTKLVEDIISKAQNVAHCATIQEKAKLVYGQMKAEYNGFVNDLIRNDAFCKDLRERIESRKTRLALGVKALSNDDLGSQDPKTKEQRETIQELRWEAHLRGIDFASALTKGHDPARVTAVLEESLSMSPFFLTFKSPLLANRREQLAHDYEVAKDARQVESIRRKDAREQIAQSQLRRNERNQRRKNQRAQVVRQLSDTQSDYSDRSSTSVSEDTPSEDLTESMRQIKWPDGEAGHIERVRWREKRKRRNARRTVPPSQRTWLSQCLARLAILVGEISMYFCCMSIFRKGQPRESTGPDRTTNASREVNVSTSQDSASSSQKAMPKTLEEAECNNLSRTENASFDRPLAGLNDYYSRLGMNDHRLNGISRLQYSSYNISKAISIRSEFATGKDDPVIREVIIEPKNSSHFSFLDKLFIGPSFAERDFFISRYRSLMGSSVIDASCETTLNRAANEWLHHITKPLKEKDIKQLSLRYFISKNQLVYAFLWISFPLLLLGIFFIEFLLSVKRETTEGAFGYSYNKASFVNIDVELSNGTLTATRLEPPYLEPVKVQRQHNRYHRWDMRAFKAWGDHDNAFLYLSIAIVFSLFFVVLLVDFLLRLLWQAAELRCAVEMAHLASLKGERRSASKSCAVEDKSRDPNVREKVIEVRARYHKLFFRLASGFEAVGFLMIIALAAAFESLSSIPGSCVARYSTFGSVTILLEFYTSWTNAIREGTGHPLLSSSQFNTLMEQFNCDFLIMGASIQAIITFAVVTSRPRSFLWSLILFIIILLVVLPFSLIYTRNRTASTIRPALSLYEWLMPFLVPTILYTIGFLFIKRFNERSNRRLYVEQRRQDCRLARLRAEQAALQKYMSDIMPPFVSQRFADKERDDEIETENTITNKNYLTNSKRPSKKSKSMNCTEADDREFDDQSKSEHSRQQAGSVLTPKTLGRARAYKMEDTYSSSERDTTNPKSDCSNIYLDHYYDKVKAYTSKQLQILKSSYVSYNAMSSSNSNKQEDGAVNALFSVDCSPRPSQLKDSALSDRLFVSTGNLESPLALAVPPSVFENEHDNDTDNNTDNRVGNDITTIEFQPKNDIANSNSINNCLREESNKDLATGEEKDIKSFMKYTNKEIFYNISNSFLAKASELRTIIWNHSQRFLDQALRSGPMRRYLSEKGDADSGAARHAIKTCTQKDLEDKGLEIRESHSRILSAYLKATYPIKKDYNPNTVILSMGFLEYIKFMKSNMPLHVIGATTEVFRRANLLLQNYHRLLLKRKELIVSTHNVIVERARKEHNEAEIKQKDAFNSWQMAFKSIDSRQVTLDDYFYKDPYDSYINLDSHYNDVFNLYRRAYYLGVIPRAQTTTPTTTEEGIKKIFIRTGEGVFDYLSLSRANSDAAKHYNMYKDVVLYPPQFIANYGDEVVVVFNVSPEQVPMYQDFFSFAKKEIITKAIHAENKRKKQSTSCANPVEAIASAVAFVYGKEDFERNSRTVFPFHVQETLFFERLAMESDLRTKLYVAWDKFNRQTFNNNSFEREFLNELPEEGAVRRNFSDYDAIPPLSLVQIYEEYVCFLLMADAAEHQLAEEYSLYKSSQSASILLYNLNRLDVITRGLDIARFQRHWKRFLSERNAYLVSQEKYERRLKKWMESYGNKLQSIGFKGEPDAKTPFWQPLRISGEQWGFEDDTMKEPMQKLLKQIKVSDVPSADGNSDSEDNFKSWIRWRKMKDKLQREQANTPHPPMQPLPPVPPVFSSEDHYGSEFSLLRKNLLCQETLGKCIPNNLDIIRRLAPLAADSIEKNPENAAYYYGYVMQGSYGNNRRLLVDDITAYSEPSMPNDEPGELTTDVDATSSADWAMFLPVEELPLQTGHRSTPDIVCALHCGVVLGEVPGMSPATWRYILAGDGVRAARTLVRRATQRNRALFSSQAVTAFGPLINTVLDSKNPLFTLDPRSYKIVFGENYKNDQPRQKMAARFVNSLRELSLRETDICPNFSLIDKNDPRVFGEVLLDLHCNLEEWSVKSYSTRLKNRIFIDPVPSVLFKKTLIASSYAEAIQMKNDLTNWKEPTPPSKSLFFSQVRLLDSSSPLYRSNATEKEFLEHQDMNSLASTETRSLEEGKGILERIKESPIFSKIIQNERLEQAQELPAFSDAVKETFISRNPFEDAAKGLSLDTRLPAIVKYFFECIGFETDDKAGDITYLVDKNGRSPEPTVLSGGIMETLARLLLSKGTFAKHDDMTSFGDIKRELETEYFYEFTYFGHYVRPYIIVTLIQLFVILIAFGTIITDFFWLYTKYDFGVYSLVEGMASFNIETDESISIGFQTRTFESLYNQHLNSTRTTTELLSTVRRLAQSSPLVKLYYLFIPAPGSNDTYGDSVFMHNDLFGFKIYFSLALYVVLIILSVYEIGARYIGACKYRTMVHNRKKQEVAERLGQAIAEEAVALITRTSKVHTECSSPKYGGNFDENKIFRTSAKMELRKDPVVFDNKIAHILLVFLPRFICPVLKQILLPLANASGFPSRTSMTSYNSFWLTLATTHFLGWPTENKVLLLLFHMNLYFCFLLYSMPMFIQIVMGAFFALFSFVFAVVSDREHRRAFAVIKMQRTYGKELEKRDGVRSALIDSVIPGPLKSVFEQLRSSNPRSHRSGWMLHDMEASNVMENSQKNLTHLMVPRFQTGYSVSSYMSAPSATTTITVQCATLIRIRYDFFVRVRAVINSFLPADLKRALLLEHPSVSSAIRAFFSSHALGAFYNLIDFLLSRHLLLSVMLFSGDEMLIGGPWTRLRGERKERTNNSVGEVYKRDVCTPPTIADYFQETVRFMLLLDQELTTLPITDEGDTLSNYFTAIATADEAVIVVDHSALFPTYSVGGPGPLKLRQLVEHAPQGTIAVTESFVTAWRDEVVDSSRCNFIINESDRSGYELQWPSLRTRMFLSVSNYIPNNVVFVPYAGRWAIRDMPFIRMYLLDLKDEKSS